MNRETFLKLYVTTCVLVQKDKPHRRMQMPLQVEKQVAVSLYYLADERRMRKVANAFGIGKSTVLKVVRGVIMTTSRLLGPQYIKHPQTTKKVQEMATHFQEYQCELLGSILGHFCPYYMPKHFSCRHEKRFGIVQTQPKSEIQGNGKSFTSRT